MDIVLLLHSRLSNTVWLFFLFLGLWGLFRALHGRGVDGSYLGAVVIGQLLFVIEVILGAILWAGGFLPNLARPSIHVLYGGFVLVFLPFVYLVLLRGDDSNRGQWVLGLVNLFLFGVALRLITTGV